MDYVEQSLFYRAVVPVMGGCTKRRCLFYCGSVCVWCTGSGWVVVCKSHQEETRYTTRYSCSCSVRVDTLAVVVLGHECAANARLFVSFTVNEETKLTHQIHCS